MTTEELVLQINRNHRVRAEKIDGRIFVYNDTIHLLFTFDEKATNFLDFTFNDQLPSDSMGKTSREYVAAQIEEYLQTPIEERNPQKYYLCASKEKGLYVHNVRVMDYPYDKSFSFEFGPKAEFSERSLRDLVKAVPNVAPALEAMKEPVEEDD